VLGRREPWWIELLSGAVAVSWALHVAVSIYSLDTVPAYRAVARFLPADVWAAVGIVGGTFQVAATVCDRAKVRAAAAYAMGVFWLVLADGIRASLPSSPTVMLFVGFAAANAIAAFHALAARQ
jgi:hypothetical protein